MGTCQDSGRTKGFREPRHFEDQPSARVAKAGLLADLAEGLARRTSVEQAQLPPFQPERFQDPCGIQRPDVHLPDGLPPCVAPQRRGAVRIVLDGADGLEAGLVDADVHAARTGEQADGRPVFHGARPSSIASVARQPVMHRRSPLPIAFRLRSLRIVNRFSFDGPADDRAPRAHQEPLF